MFGWLKEKSSVILDTYKRDLSEFALAIAPTLTEGQPGDSSDSDSQRDPNETAGGRSDAAGATSSSSSSGRRGVDPRIRYEGAGGGGGGGPHIKALQRNASTYTAAITDEERESFDDWVKDFSLDAKTEDISELLNTAEMRRIHSEIVPEKVSYRDFWTRYFFRAHKLEMLKNLTDASYVEDEFSWDMEDEEGPKSTPSAETTSTTTSAIATASTNIESRETQATEKTPLQNLEERNAELEKKIQFLQQELAVFSQTTEGDASTSVSEQMAQLWRQRFEDTEKQNAMLKEEVQMLQHDQRLHLQTIARLERQVNNLSQQLSEWDSDRIKHERIIGTLKSQISEQQNVIAQLTAQIKAQFDTDERLRGHIDRLSKRLKHQQQQQQQQLQQQQQQQQTVVDSNSPEPSLAEELASLPKILHVDSLLQQLSSKLRQFTLIDNNNATQDETEQREQQQQQSPAVEPTTSASASTSAVASDDSKTQSPTIVTITSSSEHPQQQQQQSPSAASSDSATSSDESQSAQTLSRVSEHRKSPSGDEWELVSEGSKSDTTTTATTTTAMTTTTTTVQDSKSDSADEWE